MASQLECLIKAQHARTRTELILAFAVVEPGIASRHQQECLVARTHCERLGDLSRFYAERLGRLVDSGRAVLDVDEPQIGCAFCQPMDSCVAVSAERR